jgi:hypothetical protein
MARGAFQFDTSDDGDVDNSSANVEALRRLWLHRTLVVDPDIGPGDRGDFALGAWHVSCHLAGAGGARRCAGGELAWLEISHDAARDDYFASLTTRVSGSVQTVRLDSAEGRGLLAGSELLGFVEGNSTGRISARGPQDPPNLFNTWRRQDFDRPVPAANEKDPADGGKVWEHWCTLRDIRPESRIGTGVLSAYVSLVSALGDHFAALVARGRRDYGHPVQLAAMVYAGFIGEGSAKWAGTPSPLPKEAADLLLEASPAAAWKAVTTLDWSSPLRYYMYQRRIGHWSKAADVAKDLKAFKPEG